MLNRNSNFLSNRRKTHSRYMDRRTSYHSHFVILSLLLYLHINSITVSILVDIMKKQPLSVDLPLLQHPPSEYIPPPFPFPHLWEDVFHWQNSVGQKYWLVPDLNITDSGKLETLRNLQNNDSDEVELSSKDFVPKNQELEIPADMLACDDKLVLNDYWVERFSKTLKKIKVKSIKAKNRMKWSKNKEAGNK